LSESFPEERYWEGGLGRTLRSLQVSLKYHAGVLDLKIR
jgi:hypothetical protein